MKKSMKWLYSLGAASLMLVANISFVHADNRDARDRQITIMPNPAGTPGRTGVLRSGPVPAPSPSRIQPRVYQRSPRRTVRYYRRWYNGRWHYYRVRRR